MHKREPKRVQTTAGALRTGNLATTAGAAALLLFTSCRAERHVIPEPGTTRPDSRAVEPSSIPGAPAAVEPSASTPARTLVPRERAEKRNDFPCHGCETRLPATSDSEAPAPLLVVLHGDLGDVTRMTQVWQKAALDRGMVLTSLLCPRDKGCRSSWWKWYLGPSHEPSWLGAQIDVVSQQVAIDPARVYAAGYSGGASYLGYYGPAHPERFAAIAYVAGGVRFVSECAARKTPVLFLIGNQDPMLPLYVDKLHAFYEGCGNPIAWSVLPGVTHDGIVPMLQAGKAADVVEWMRGGTPAQ